MKEKEVKQAYFPFFIDWATMLKTLSNDQAGILLRALCSYVESGEEPDLHGDEQLKLIVPFMLKVIARHSEHYAEKVTKSRRAANIRWGNATSDANASERMQRDANASERIRTYPNASERMQTHAYDADACAYDADACKIKENKIKENKIREEKRKEGEIKRDAPTPSPFTPPTLEEVKAYASEIGAISSPDKFFHYYERMGWTRKSGLPVDDWKKSFATWEAGEKKGAFSQGSSSGTGRRGTTTKPNRFTNFEQREYNFEELEDAWLRKGLENETDEDRD